MSLNRKEVVAIELSEEAKIVALSKYHGLYQSNAIIPDDLYLTLLNDCLVLSQQKVEGRLISTKIIIPDYDEHELKWPLGVHFVRIEEVLLTHLNLGDLKKYLEIAGDPNTFLVITIVNKEYFRFKLEGFLFFEESIQSFVFNYNPWTTSPVAKNIKGAKSKIQDKIGSFYRSVFLSIDNGEITVSFYNNKFLIIEKGFLPSIPDIRRASQQIIEISSGFCKHIGDLIDKRKDTIDDLMFFNIKEYIHTIIKNIVLNISDAKHGSTLIFGYDGESDDQNLFQPGAIKLKIPIGREIIKLAQNIGPSYFSADTEFISKKIQTYENAIISLSKTDGAIIFNTNMDLILAGAILKVGSSAIGSGGARRKSAEAFVSDTKTIGIVISQDGNITILPLEN